jgi:hypothetical protein
MRQKVMVYVVREVTGRRELLVFEHQNDPEASVQVLPGAGVSA